jgi:hypothetical protein
LVLKQPGEWTSVVSNECWHCSRAIVLVLFEVDAGYCSKDLGKWLRDFFGGQCSSPRSTIGNLLRYFSQSS